MLSAAFATLSQELHMPPFTLFLIALSLTDGNVFLLKMDNLDLFI